MATRWQYQDARGVWVEGEVVKVFDRGGTDVTYMFRRTDGTIDMVSGSRLKGAKVIRQNPARWAHGTIDYQRRVNPRWDVGERVQFRRTRRRVRLPAHRHLNPFHRNPGAAGGLGIGTLALLGVGGFLLYRAYAGGGALFGPTAPATVPQGFIPVGSGLYRGPDGAVYARNPTTGAMVRAPVGSTPQDAESLLTQAGVALIPQAASTLANWIGGLFGSQRSATTPAPGTTYATRPPTPSGSTMPSTGLPAGIAPMIPALPGAITALSSFWPASTATEVPGVSGGALDVYRAGEHADYLAPSIPGAPSTEVLPTDSSWWPAFEGDGATLDTLPSADTGWMDWAQYDWGAAPADFTIPDFSPDFATVDYAFDVPEVPVTDWSGFMGLGRARRSVAPTTAVRGYGRRPASIG